MRVLILSMHDGEQFLLQARAVGASGFLLKSAVDREVIEACRAAMRGGRFQYPADVSIIVRDRIERDHAGAAHGPVTPREQQVIRLIAEARPTARSRGH